VRALTKVLIVEDVEEMAELLKMTLEARDFTVTGLAKSVWEARELLSRSRPEFLLLDEVIPGESPIDFVSECGVLELPVVLMTGMDSPSHAIAEGALGRVIKPTADDLGRGRPGNFVDDINKLTKPLRN